MISRLFVVLLFAFAGVAYGQQKELKFDYISKEKGLSSSDVTAVVQDHQGFIWIGTNDGLNRYDGYTIKTYRNIPDDASSLCDNKISVLFVDHLGELWIGTENNGLSRYHRQSDSFVNFPFRAHDSNSLSYYYVTSIVEDSNHNLWIGTHSGLNLFNRETQNFTQYLRQVRYVFVPEVIEELKERGMPERVIAALRKLQNQELTSSQSVVNSLMQELSKAEVALHKTTILAAARIATFAESIRSLEAGKQGLWVGFEQDGLGFFDTSKKQLRKHSFFSGKSLSNSEIMSLKLDGDQLWIGTRNGGINRLDLGNHQLYHYPYSYEKKHVKNIFKDRQGNIWVGDGEGLSLYDRALNRFHHYGAAENGNNGLSTPFVNTIAEDAQGNLWIGCEQGGLNVATLNQPFVYLSNKVSDEASLSKKSVSAVLKDSRGNLWVGYFSSGLDFWDGTTHQKVHYSFNAQNPNSLGDGTVFKIFEDSRGKIWIGTYRGGLQCFDEQKKQFISYRHDPQNATSIGGNDVRDIAEDREGNLWLAIHGGGVNKFQKASNTFVRYRASYTDWKNSLANDWVNALLYDNKGRLWAGTVSGVSVMEPGANTFRSYNHSNSSLSHNSVRTIFQDARQRIWVGTENGLNLYLEGEKNFKTYSEKQGLPNSFIMGGVADKAGNLWISTNDGITKFNPEQQMFRNYSVLDGLQSNEFFPGAYCMSKDGHIYFGGKAGLNYFDPAGIRDNEYKPPVVITEFRLFNQKVPIGGEDSPLQQHISQTKEITLSYSQNVIGFEFAGLNYIRPEKNQYAYMLEGFEKSWNYVGNKREATYTNLDPGMYVLRVKAANNDGVWNEEGASLRIIVMAPWWRSPLAYISYALLILLGLLIGRRIMLQQARVRFQIEQEREQARQRHELDVMKLRFFTNISHEFRTPLALILAPLERLVSEPPSEHHQRQYLMIQRNAKRLLRLVNQLLDFRKLEVEGLSFYPSQGDIIKFLAESVHSFSELSRNRNISLQFQSDLAELQATFDMDKLEKILFNLLNNAFKFTPDGGEIKVAVDYAATTADAEGRQLLQIKVIDNGIGIPEDKLEKVFERFYTQHDLPPSMLNQGSGIGLSLTREFVKIHGGTISVESEVGKGSCFTVCLPLSGAAEPVFGNLLKPEEATVEAQLPPLEIPEPKPQKKVPQEKLPLILLVEDNDDFRQYLRENMSAYFEVAEAANGKEGWQKALALMPELILSDLMMPELNGIELCKKIKEDARTAHIPFVLLTAHAAEEQKLKGLNLGANDYITKPFSYELLLTRVRNLVQQRQQMKQVFEKKISVETSQAEIVSLDDKLIQKAIKLVEENMSDSDFSVEQLSKELGMSRAHLYKKMVSITGDSPVEFIRKIRLERAAQFLEKSQLTVAEVAYKVGFNNTKYFTKYFKAQYNVLPSAYATSKQQGGRFSL